MRHRRALLREFSISGARCFSTSSKWRRPPKRRPRRVQPCAYWWSSPETLHVFLVQNPGYLMAPIFCSMTLWTAFSLSQYFIGIRR
jgi:hypothetical protein